MNNRRAAAATAVRMMAVSDITSDLLATVVVPALGVDDIGHVHHDDDVVVQTADVVGQVLLLVVVVVGLGVDVVAVVVVVAVVDVVAAVDVVAVVVVVVGATVVVVDGEGDTETTRVDWQM